MNIYFAMLVTLIYKAIQMFYVCHIYILFNERNYTLNEIIAVFLNYLPKYFYYYFNKHIKIY